VIPHLTQALAQFAEAMAAPYDPDELLHQLVLHASELLEASGAGIMLADQRGELRFVAASDERVVLAEKRQDELREGACFEAYLRNEPVSVSDLREHLERWPGYTPGVLDLGFHAVLGVPLRGAGTTIGVLNVYWTATKEWEDDEVHVATVLGVLGTGYVLNSNQRRDLETVVGQLQAAIASRDLIGQAKGILMAERDLDADAAFDVLRAQSQRTNRKLRDVAAQVVAEHRRTS
jgi:signal transduction protein with GAF and PtsI domain